MVIKIESVEDEKSKGALFRDVSIYDLMYFRTQLDKGTNEAIERERQ
jgi:hypothetical protein